MSAKRVSSRDASYLPAVDEYIAAAAPFAQPILERVRKAVHKAQPDVEEAMKWSRPFFLYQGLILGNMSAFQQHCSVNLWGEEIADKLRADGVYDGKAMGVLGRLTSVKDLPADRELTDYIRAGAAAIESGRRTKNYSRAKAAPKPAAEVPPGLAAALQKNKVAAKQFAAMPPGAQREYSEWIAEAKRDETRDKRVATAVEWIAEGKRRNWKYEAC